MSATSSHADATEIIKILIADDHPAFSQGLSRLLAEERDIEVVAIAHTGEEAISLAKDLSPNIVVMDVNMPGLSGIEATKQIKATCPETAVLILTAYDYEPYIFGALEAGASGCLLKTNGIDQIIGALRAVSTGEAVLSSAVTEKVLRRLGYARTGKSPEILHRREVEILRLGARGLTNKEIAQKLVISQRTVQTHFVNIFKKLKVGSRTEAVLLALKEGWLNPDDLP
ncbi:MAG: response regulator transcription factor [Chloroflexi bacterium]|nr:response regulator transcription factor [Chloroflexota bacterium]